MAAVTFIGASTLDASSRTTVNPGTPSGSPAAGDLLVFNLLLYTSLPSITPASGFVTTGETPDDDGGGGNHIYARAYTKTAAGGDSVSFTLGAATTCACWCTAWRCADGTPVVYDTNSATAGGGTTQTLPQLVTTGGGADVTLLHAVMGFFQTAAVESSPAFTQRSSNIDGGSSKLMSRAETATGTYGAYTETLGGGERQAVIGIAMTTPSVGAVVSYPFRRRPSGLLYR
jgi:hypothetical protein